ncbi:hypothetical protein [Streptomyces rubiginosohelvolus]|uniref:hypothetical protein n=1 Tax=Streptomyces rubiginosohelvolus TaxID=67362 RepID=UPI0036BB8DC8
MPDDDDARPVIFLLTTQHSADAPKVDWDAVTITTSGQVVEGDGQVLQSFVNRPYPKELRESDYLVEDDAGRASLAFEFVDLGFDAAALKDRSEQGHLTTEIKFTLGDWYAACLIKFDGPLSEMLKLSGYKA